MTSTGARLPRHRGWLAGGVIGILLLAATCALIFGPARGLRDDIGHLRTDLHSSRKGIYGTLATTRRSLMKVTAQLRVTEQSLRISSRA